jgi:molecular chaperone GrpE
MQNKGRSQQGADPQQGWQQTGQSAAQAPDTAANAAQNKGQSGAAQQNQTESVAQLQQQLQDEQNKAEEYLDMLRRTQADFINYRRRMTQEQDENRASVQISVLQQILPVIDDLDRALAVVPPDLANNSWVQGVVLASRRIDSTLERLGVREIGKPGERFDPHWMEALASEAKPGVPEGTILTVARPGFALGDRLIRPAQVIVAGASSPSTKEAASTQSGNTNAGNTFCD